MAENITKKVNFYECYLIEIQGCKFAYTNAQSDVNHNGITFRAIPISREEIIISTDTKKGDVNITMSKAADFFKIFRLGVPWGDIDVTFYLFDDNQNQINLYKYQAFSVSISESKIMLACSNESYIYDQKINEVYYSRVCRHNLYDSNCLVKKENHSINLNGSMLGLSVISTDNVSEGELSDYVGGYIEFSRTFSQYNEYGDSYTFLYRVNVVAIGYENGDTSGRSLFHISENIWASSGESIPIVAYKGCEKTADYCRDMFNNVPNFGGQPEIPTENPNGKAVF